MPSETYLVPTDADGTQHHGEEITQWPLPQPVAGGGWQPGEFLEPAMGVPIVLRNLDGLLDDLGERIFLAEIVTAAAPDEHESVRLTAESGWTLFGAARFALDCAEHVVSEPAALLLPSGASLADVFAEARRYLSRDDGAGTGLLQALSRVALARRLRHLGDEVADLALGLTIEDESAEADVLDDPVWAAVASTRDSVLSAVEAIRHDAFPRLFEGQNSRYESDANAIDPLPEVVSTPWGNFVGGRRAGIVPAWVAARDAAERARQAMSETGGVGAEEAERAWQRRHLAAALDLDPSLLLA
ncbi:MAG: hypothetical protein ACYCSF_01750 [Acidimicrobiales bacterium]